MEVRILEERDTKRYMALRAQAANEYPKYPDRDLDRELFHFADHPTTVMSEHTRQGTVVWGAYDGYLLVGTLAISRRFDVVAGHYLWLWGLYVRPRYRGTPASRLLMEAMLAWCGGEARDRRLLSAYDRSNEQAARFLYRWGFHPVVGMTRGRPNACEMSGQCVLVERDRA